MKINSYYADIKSYLTSIQENAKLYVHCLQTDTNFAWSDTFFFD